MILLFDFERFILICWLSLSIPLLPECVCVCLSDCRLSRELIGCCPDARSLRSGSSRFSSVSLLSDCVGDVFASLQAEDGRGPGFPGRNIIRHVSPVSVHTCVSSVNQSWDYLACLFPFALYWFVCFAFVFPAPVLLCSFACSAFAPVWFWSAFIKDYFLRLQLSSGGLLLCFCTEATDFIHMYPNFWLYSWMFPWDSSAYDIRNTEHW